MIKIFIYIYYFIDEPLLANVLRLSNENGQRDNKISKPDRDVFSVEASLLNETYCHQVIINLIKQL